MHNSSYNIIYFKYVYRKNKWCQFDFLCLIINTFFVDQYRVIKLKKNNSWVNSWNLVLNYNINFLSMKMKVLVIIYYITNHITKNNFIQTMAKILEILIIRHIKDLNLFNKPIINLSVYIRLIIEVLFPNDFY